MEYTVQFYKSNITSGRTIMHETTICESDETTLKREVTKITKTLEPFQQLQAECPISWGNWGYGNDKSFGKTWSAYDKKFPLSDSEKDTSYSIFISLTSRKFQTAEKRLSEAHNRVQESLELLTDRSHSYDPDISKIDPEIAEIINIDLPKHVQALINLLEGANKRLSEKIRELNERN